MCRLRIVYDMMDVSRQIGIVPRQASRSRGRGGRPAAKREREKPFSAASLGAVSGFGANVKAVPRMLGHASRA